MTGQFLADTHGQPGAVALPVPVPVPVPFNRLVRVLADLLEHPGRPARAATTTPVGPSHRRWRCGWVSWCRVVTTRLEVMAISEYARPVCPELTIALDVATRSVVAAVLREESTQAVDRPCC
ncbi:hypothetical protein [Streptomyces lancefieldiae]|uniref:Transposase n=1 Tax=Streptomyces lancefieldiae TaxID=3075520 RepID=A0ABU3APX4_9ACTN|nr:hypothetical protein [Streptomyces sp. DSM 40712]MDT0612232.1 hypothetical protein [Streptomyces sp. DSM 40712]